MSDVSPPLPIARTVAALRETVREWRRQGLSVALVPTMGALHDGHMTLIAEARAQADRVIASVFVNPAQFAAHEDLGTYPRREARDAEMLTQAGCDLMYAPAAAEMYPAGFVTSVAVGDAATGGPSQDLEGAFRPAMFGGVAVVVSKLLNQAQADVAVFGEKDWQQLAVVRRMVADLDIPTRIVGVPTARDGHGLALSSRNGYLSDEELQVARRLNGVLAETAVRAANGEPVSALEAEAVEAILKAGFARVDYVAIRQPDLNVFETERVEGPGRILTAAVLGTTRLIDNMAVG